MRQVLSGKGVDTTAQVLAYLKAGNEFQFATLYLIGYPEDPNALWLTDWPSPLYWPLWGVPATGYLPAVIKRGPVTSQFGFNQESIDIEWTPKSTPYGVTQATANVYQLAQEGYYDNYPVRLWTAYMPTPGDAMTYGCSQLFGGVIADTKIRRGQITWKVNSFLCVVDEMVPANVIELYDNAIGYTGATPPTGFSTIPQFDVISGSSNTVIIGDCTNIGPHHVFGTNAFQNGYLFFNGGGTLPGFFRAIQQNTSVTVAFTNYNQFVLYEPLPWPPTPGVDTFYVSATAPQQQGFPYVPDPSMAI